MICESQRSRTGIRVTGSIMHRPGHQKRGVKRNRAAELQAIAAVSRRATAPRSRLHGSPLGGGAAASRGPVLGGRLFHRYSEINPCK